jgi:hypothetical protein
MQVLLEENASIKPDHLEVPIDSDIYKMPFVQEGHHWVTEIYNKEYVEVLRIKKMQPEAVWQRYKRWGVFDEHREVILLRKAINVLRTAVVARSRPDFFKKSKRQNKANKTKAGLEAEKHSQAGQ